MAETGTDSELVLVFVPPLAVLLAAAEKAKGSHLTETEVIAIRDKSSCIAMTTDAADKMTESRGFRDVDGEACWADWHRVRSHVTGGRFLPKIVLCLLGNDQFKDLAVPLLESKEIEYEVQERDERMSEIFRRTRPNQFDESDLKRIDEHTVVMYILSRNYRASEGPYASHFFLQAGAQLLQAGAAAIKCESSGAKHCAKSWIDLAHQSGPEPNNSPEFWLSLFRAFVEFPIIGGDDIYTCGMHLLGSPDAIISQSVLKEAQKNLHPVEASAYLLYLFCGYLLTECGEGGFVSGRNFQPDEEWPLLRVEWEPCSGYEEDDFYFNPFGRWRFTGLTNRSAS